MLVKYCKRDDNIDRGLPVGMLLLIVVLLSLTPNQGRSEIQYEWAGFGTIGMGVLDDNSINETNGLPHNLYDDDVQFDVDSRLGLQGSAYFNDSLSATFQVITDSSAVDDIQLEWAYFSYDVNQNLKVRMGRQRRPLYALTDVLPVGYVYPWARPPVEVYSRDLQVYDEIDAINILYQFPVNDWDFTTEFYYGGSSGEAQVARDEQGGYESRDDRGIVLQMEKDWLSLRLSYHVSPDFDVDPSENLKMLYQGLELAGFSSIADDMRKQGLDGEFYTISAGIDYQDWLFNAEIIQLSVENGAVPEEESWYIMGGRRIGPWTLHLTYAKRDRDSDLEFSQPIRDLAANPFLPPAQAAQLLQLAGGVDAVVDGQIFDQNSYTLGVRYDFDEPISIKAEYQYIEDNQFDLSNNLISLVVDFLF